ncbi:hypothetical protein J5N97_018363 [Dioscorea zingiberensis]|uniref:AMP-dependent synthetase/ligase domain-containing protein n=1 Tax=Dioscorea zingiberensis TaxID=325984 RepID=A0A9D5HHA7_9LILI|nr:hypothetical protein J5N97_018363 [Dioscorea zingiberensis]
MAEHCFGYTSGTTSNPKGVVLHHRGVYLMSLSGALSLGMNERTVYLWILRMFHCNAIAKHWVTVLSFRVTHTYGLSVTYAPSTVCAWKPEWDQLPPEIRAKLHCRQGVRYLALENLDIVDVKTMAPVPADGVTLGEIVMLGNSVMKGYLKNPKANEAFENGWFHSGDLVHRAIMDQSELKHNLIGLDIGEEFQIMKDVKVKAFRTRHVIPSQGYIIYSMKPKLKVEYAGLS